MTDLFTRFSFFFFFSFFVAAVDRVRSVSGPSAGGLILFSNYTFEAVGE